MIKRKLIAFYNNLRIRLSSSNNFLFIGFYKYFYFPKEGTLEYLLNDYSKKNKKDFIVIQIGANDGINNDPIHKFIKRDKWKGVLLEPQKEVFDKFLTKVYKKNKEITLVNAALGEEDGFRSIYKIGFSNARWATGLGTFDKEVLLSAFESGYVKFKADKDNIVIPTNIDEQIIEERVVVISPKTLLKKYEIGKIDLLQIDAEGYDYEVIKMFKIEETKPKLIVFEHLHIAKEELKECIGYLQLNGYETTDKGANSIDMLKPVNDYASFFNN